MENYKEFLKKAKELNAKIELIVEADAGDADYVYLQETYSEEEFEEYNIFDIYNILKTLEGRRGVWYVIEKRILEECDERDEYFFDEIKLTPQDEKIIAEDYDAYDMCDYIPFNIINESDPVHTIVSVSLRLVIPFENI